MRDLSGESPKFHGPVPSAVALVDKKNAKPFRQGTFITLSWILTAGHCVENFSEENLEVWAGSSNLTQSMKLSAKRIERHPNYTRKLNVENELEQLEDDLALIEIFQDEIEKQKMCEKSSCKDFGTCISLYWHLKFTIPARQRSMRFIA